MLLKTFQRNLKNSENVLLLLIDLQEFPLALELNISDFPKSIKMSSVYRFLEFDHRDRKIECERLMSLENMEKGVLLNAYDFVKE